MGIPLTSRFEFADYADGTFIDGPIDLSAPPARVD